MSVTVPLSTSDHNTIILKTNLVGKPTNSTASPYWDFEHADYTAINAYSRLSINFDFSLGMLDIGRHYPLIPFPNSTSLSYPSVPEIQLEHLGGPQAPH